MKTTCRLIAVLCMFCMLFSWLASCSSDTETEELPTPKKLKWAVGTTLPTAEDFFDTLPKHSSVRFATEIDVTKMGEHTLCVIYTSPEGTESTLDVSLTLAVDTLPPRLVGVKDLSVCLGDGIAYRSGVTATDDFDGPVTISVDSSQVVATGAGSYPVTYTAKDHAGNTSSATVTVWIYREQVTMEMLWSRVDEIINRYSIDEYVSKETQAREVFDYVYYGIKYDSTSDKNDWVRAAYEGLKNGKGDCYTYFAVSKAFFERLGIDNRDIKRTEGIVSERHYWNLINIGSEDAPAWYHFDACQLGGISFRGCLLTDSQLAEYTQNRISNEGIGGYFYVYNEKGLPTRATEIITDPYHY